MDMKGTQYEYGPTLQLKNDIINKLTTRFEQYGALPMQSPILQPLTRLVGKYDDDAEIINEIYTVQNRGERDIGLRYDLTVPLAAYIAQFDTIKTPFKRYEIGKVFRDGPVKQGRYREFTQCDFDIIGVENTSAEIELILLLAEGFADIGVDVTIEINNQKLLLGVLELVGVTTNVDRVILTMDKLKKIGWPAVKEQLALCGVTPQQNDELERTFTKLATNETIVNAPALLQEGLNELQQVIDGLTALNIANYRFVPTLSRGLALYTGTIFEVFMSDGSFPSALASGGRYDRIIGQWSEKRTERAAVGCSFGIDAILSILVASLPRQRAMLVISLGQCAAALDVARSLRQAGLTVWTDTTERKLKRSFHFAEQNGIETVVIVGENEKNSGRYLVKSMVTYEQQSVTLQELIAILK